MCHIILTCNDDPCGIHIDSVHNTRTNDSADAGQLVPAMVHKAVYKGMAVMSCCRVHHHAFGFVDEDDILVLVEDVQVHGLRINLRLHGFRHLQLNPVLFHHTIACLHALAVNQDLP